MPDSFLPPVRGAASFTCPSCGVVSRQTWQGALVVGGGHSAPDFDAARCDHCGRPSFWRETELIWPDLSSAPTANADLDAAERALYNEAASVVGRSPRSAAALLRLLTERLTRRVSVSTGNLNVIIGELVRAGRLSPETQRALDALRIIGNNAVHPGQIDFDERADVAWALFRLVNFVAEKLLTEPREIEEIWASLPEEQRSQAERRDGN